ncbi:MAG: hypothetical protein AAF709_21555 [Pseudomonadota bacterium]
MEQPILAKDMKWPYCKGSLVPTNTWNTHLEDLMEALFNAEGQPWWCCDTDLKYINLRIDTRDNAFILSVKGRGEDAQDVRIDPQRVVDAIAKWNTNFEDGTGERQKDV